MKVLSLNCGSSSVKYMLYDWDRKEIMAKGLVERVTLGNSYCTHEVAGKDKIRIDHDCPDHATAIKLIADMLAHPEYGVVKDITEIAGVGHRVVHGGEKFAKSVLIDEEALRTFKDLSGLAPLHNPPNISGIEASQRLMPGIPQVAVMDTAWHQTLIQPQYIYAVPYEWYEKYGVRRYGFHGTSLLYLAKRAAVLLRKNPLQCNIISLHIGNGVSANAVKNGVSFDTSMGFTPLEGLVMGTRSGDHDAAIDFFLMEREGYSFREIESILNKKSGLLGITGKYVDRRDIIDEAGKGDSRAKLALEIETYRIRKYIGAYAAALGGIDALVFSAGVGEMSDLIRAKSLDGLEFMGIKYDAEKNLVAKSRNAEFDISAPDSKVKILTIPTDEELVITEDVVAIVEGKYDLHIKFKYSFSDPNYRNGMRDLEFMKELKKNPKMAAALALPFPNSLLPNEAKAYAW